MFKDFELPFLPTVLVISAVAFLVVTGLSEVFEPRDIPASQDWMWQLLHWNF